ncbi:MAG: hypothetical protein HZC40_14775 [Chloroflexi bacterium]|nr:hypothetical protein [Chloroflexota bacterium]
MDPISLAVVGALAKLSEQAIKDAYEALKALIARKFGKESDLAQAVENLEKKPESVGRKETLVEEVTASNADRDQELLQAAKALSAIIKTSSGSSQIIQTATGDQNIQVAGNDNMINVNNSKPKS